MAPSRPIVTPKNLILGILVLLGAVLSLALAVRGVCRGADTGREAPVSDIGIDAIVSHRSGVEDLILSFGPGEWSKQEIMLISFDGEVTSSPQAAGGVFDAAELLTSPWVNDGDYARFNWLPVVLLIYFLPIATFWKPSWFGVLIWLAIALVCSANALHSMIIPQYEWYSGLWTRSEGTFMETWRGDRPAAKRVELSQDKDYVRAVVEASAAFGKLENVAALRGQIDHFSNHLILVLDEVGPVEGRFFMHFMIKNAQATFPSVWTNQGMKTRERLYLVSESGVGSGEGRIAFQDQFYRQDPSGDSSEDFYESQHFRTSVGLPSFTDLMWDGCYVTRVEGSLGEGLVNRHAQAIAPRSYRAWVHTKRGFIEICAVALVLVMSWLPLVLSLLSRFDVQWHLSNRRLAGGLGLTGMLLGVLAMHVPIVGEHELFRRDEGTTCLNRSVRSMVEKEAVFFLGESYEEIVAHVDSLLGAQTNICTGRPFRNEASFGNYDIVKNEEGACVRYYEFPWRRFGIGGPDRVYIESTLLGT